MKLHFNDGWYFTESYSDELPGWDEARVKALTPVRIPHTVKELPLNYLNEQDYQMVSGYRQKILRERESWDMAGAYPKITGVPGRAELYHGGVT